MTLYRVIVAFQVQLLQVVTRMRVRLENSPGRHSENFIVMCNSTFRMVNMSWLSLKIGFSLKEILTVKVFHHLDSKTSHSIILRRPRFSGLRCYVVGR